MNPHFWLIATALCGLALLALAYRLDEHTSPSLKRYCAHGLRELGFALLIAVSVAVLFEFYQRSVEGEKVTERNFDAFMSEQLTPDVWKGVTKQILKKRLLRRDAEINFALSAEPGLRQDQSVLDLEFSYNVESLAPDEMKSDIEHELDYQFCYREKDLPRFTRLTVFAPDPGQSRDLADDELQRFCPNGVLKLQLTMPPKTTGRSARIRTGRREVVHAPGSYNLYMTEYTKNLTVRLDQPLKEVDVEVKVRPEGIGQTLVRTGNTWRSDSLILPGQGVEIKFVDVSRRTTNATPTAATISRGQ